MYLDESLVLHICIKCECMIHLWLIYMWCTLKHIIHMSPICDAFIYIFSEIYEEWVQSVTNEWFVRYETCVSTWFTRDSRAYMIHMCHWFICICIIIMCSHEWTTSHIKKKKSYFTNMWLKSSFWRINTLDSYLTNPINMYMHHHYVQSRMNHYSNISHVSTEDPDLGT